MTDTKRYSEFHVTMQGGDAAQVARLVKMIGWKFSAIAGDPNLGPGVKFYATKQFNARKGVDQIQSELDATARVLHSAFDDVVRGKIEFVLYDSRIDTVEAAGGGVMLPPSSGLTGGTATQIIRDDPEA